MILRPLYAAAMTAVGAALVGGVLACSPPSGAAPANPGGPGDPFIQCMTDNGVPAPQGGPGAQGGHPDGPPPSGAPQPGQGGTPPAPPGVDQGVWNTALQACQSLAPTPPQR